LGRMKPEQGKREAAETIQKDKSYAKSSITCNGKSPNLLQNDEGKENIKSRPGTVANSETGSMQELTRNGTTAPLPEHHK